MADAYGSGPYRATCGGSNPLLGTAFIMNKQRASKPQLKIVSTNRRARHRFIILESYEAGISLFGHEVKSLRLGRASLDEGTVRIENGEIFLLNVHISPYAHLAHIPYEPARSRKLLMHKKEIERLYGEVKTKNVALIPLEIYFKNGIAKVSVGVVKTKKREDRREELQKKAVERDIRRKFAQGMR